MPDYAFDFPQIPQVVMNIDYKLEPIADKNSAAYFYDLLDQFDCRSLHFLGFITIRETKYSKNRKEEHPFSGFRLIGFLYMCSFFTKFQPGCS